MPFTYELRTIKPKGGFYRQEVFNSTYQVLTKFQKSLYKKFVLLLEKRISSKETSIIDDRCAYF